MAKIKVYYPLTGLRIDPDNFEYLEIDEKAIQALASLFGWDGQARRMITCSKGGSLHTVSPVASEIINKVSTYPNENMTFTDQVTSEVLIHADKTNGGDVWVNIGSAGAVDTGFLLDAGDHVQFSINNMANLNVFIVTNADMVTIIRTV